MAQEAAFSGSFSTASILSRLASGKPTHPEGQTYASHRLARLDGLPRGSDACTAGVASSR